MVASKPGPASAIAIATVRSWGAALVRSWPITEIQSETLPQDGRAGLCAKQGKRSAKAQREVRAGGYRNPRLAPWTAGIDALAIQNHIFEIDVWYFAMAFGHGSAYLRWAYLLKSPRVDG